ncbi:PREDICTED: uncharacterized protein LOC106806845 [Priapulus caudatus]|uniref:Uncharacterized protein LOC106806845 n=1 Tax=Priapulus caudatus TaxID=37621 RepID=A0ABM1DWY6_PRICU|nr:PREDICTED: uncharacterized protein LOC106806845 [Priapulus caudatus]
MELTAASVAVKIVAMITVAMEYEFDKIVYWTDSMTVLRYINNQTSRFHTFVVNKVTTIQEGSTLNQWRYVPTQHNRADSAFRGLRPKDQRASEQWLLGPKYLWEPESQWPRSEFSQELSPEDPEVKKVYATLAAPGDTVTTDELFARYSNLKQLKTTVAWILRAQKCFKQRRSTDRRLRAQGSEVLTPLRVEELESAEISIVKYLQQMHLRKTENT